MVSHDSLVFQELVSLTVTLKPRASWMQRRSVSAVYFPSGKAAGSADFCGEITEPLDVCATRAAPQLDGVSWVALSGRRLPPRLPLLSSFAHLHPLRLSPPQSVTPTVTDSWTQAPSWLWRRTGPQFLLSISALSRCSQSRGQYSACACVCLGH